MSELRRFLRVAVFAATTIALCALGVALFGSAKYASGNYQSAYVLGVIAVAAALGEWMLASWESE